MIKDQSLTALEEEGDGKGHKSEYNTRVVDVNVTSLKILALRMASILGVGSECRSKAKIGMELFSSMPTRDMQGDSTIHQDMTR